MIQHRIVCEEEETMFAVLSQFALITAVEYFTGFSSLLAVEAL